jgi:hypothetical protein
MGVPVRQAVQRRRGFFRSQLLTYSCPAVSHSWSRTVRSSRYIVFDRKSMPIVACGHADVVTRQRVSVVSGAATERKVREEKKHEEKTKKTVGEVDTRE